MTANRFLDWIIGFSFSFIVLTVAIQLIIGFATNTNFIYDVDWQASLMLGGAIAFIASIYESVEG